MVNTAAINGDSHPISRDGSARASSLSRMLRLFVDAIDRNVACCVRPHAAHPYADFFDVRLAYRLQRRKPALRDDGDPVADFEQFVQLLRYHQNRDAIVAEVDDLLPNERRRTDVDAP